MSEGPVEGVPKRKRTCGSSVPRWTLEEEERLVGLVEFLGLKSWALISKELGTNRSGSGVEQHWNIMTGKRKRNGKSCNDQSPGSGVEVLDRTTPFSPRTGVVQPPRLHVALPLLNAPPSDTASGSPRSLSASDEGHDRMDRHFLAFSGLEPRPFHPGVMVLDGSDVDVDASWRWLLHGRNASSEEMDVETGDDFVRSRSAAPKQRRRRGGASNTSVAELLELGWTVVSEERVGEVIGGTHTLADVEAEQLVQQFLKLQHEAVDQSVEIHGWHLEYKQSTGDGGGGVKVLSPQGESAQRGGGGLCLPMLA